MRVLISILTLIFLTAPALASDFIQGQDVQQSTRASFVTVIEYFNEDCPHCQAMEPILSDVQRLYPDVKLYKVNAPDPVLKEIYAVSGTPEFLVFKDGELTYQVKGFIPFNVIKKLVCLPYQPKQGDFASLPSAISAGCCSTENQK